MNEKNISKKEFNTFKGRILKCLGDKKPSPWGISIGLSRGAVSRIFGRDKIPTWEHLVLISESLGNLSQSLFGVSFVFHCTSSGRAVFADAVKVFMKGVDVPANVAVETFISASFEVD